MFPEGTRSPDGRLRAVKGGPFGLAVETGLPVQPVAILGTHAVLPKDIAGPQRGGEVVVRIGEMIPTHGLAGGPGRRVLAARSRAALLALGVPDGAPEGAGGGA